MSKPLFGVPQQKSIWATDADDLAADYNRTAESMKISKEKAASKIHSDWQYPFAGTEDPTIVMYEQREVDDYFISMQTRLSDPDEISKAGRLCNAIRESGHRRKLRPLVKSWRLLLDDLAVKFPNFARAGVIDYLRAMCALAELHPQRILSIELEPLLFNGPPGVGKTMFAKRLANLFGSGYKEIKFETAQSSAALTGSDEFFSNSKPGSLFQWFLEKDSANPVFLLDELEKGNSTRDWNPLNSLYSLFERETSSNFSDLCIPGISLNASYVMWICTSNDASLLPEPILSRMRVFDIPAMTDSESQLLSHSLFKSVLNDYQAAGHLSLSSEASLSLMRFSPREMKAAIRMGIGSALYAGRKTVLATDVSPQKVTKRQSIGFSA